MGHGEGGAQQKNQSVFHTGVFFTHGEAQVRPHKCKLGTPKRVDFTGIQWTQARTPETDSCSMSVESLSSVSPDMTKTEAGYPRHASHPEV